MPVLQDGGTQARRLVLPSTPERESVSSCTCQAFKARLPGSLDPASKAACSHKKNIWVGKWTQPAKGKDPDSDCRQESWADVQG